ncbi:cation-translocating P-type ATPase [Roseibium aggregatum]|uniref:cation-translocating P-type ATPase n=1 Tax=Roseibium aggregatum TaxID=187304 RepID=UPI001E5C97B7|nr:cation-transporting P-type ATPase [Roseibium aggregatum]
MIQTSMDIPFAQDADVLAQELSVQPTTGLANDDVAKRRALYGPNTFRKLKSKSALAIFAHQFASIIVWLLAAAVVMSLLLNDIADAIAISIVLVLNGAIGFFTELRAARSMEALLRITTTHSRVRRSGKVYEVEATELVPGDIVILEAGDVVTADLRLTAASDLHCDESLLTGESVPVEKQTATMPADTLLAERLNMAFSGTAVTQGLGEGIVVATGMTTELGRISTLAQEAEAEVSPLEKRLDRLGRKLVWLTAALAMLTILAGILWGHPLPDMLKTGIALAVAAIPEGLPIVATLCLARGMWRMAARNALVTELSAVETLGATTLILTDKTGTLTENRMSAARYLLDGTSVDILQQDKGLRFCAQGQDIAPAAMEPLSAALRIGALCNTAEYGESADATRIGDPMEISLLATAAAAGLARSQLLQTLTPAGQHAFTPLRKMMATVHHDGEDHFLYAVKGAPEAVLDASEAVLGPAGTRLLTDEDRASWRKRQSEAGRRGERLLALAFKTAATPSEDPYEGLTLIALVCFVDPLRDDVPTAIRASQQAGVRVVMMTGDHAETAAKIAEDAGIGTSGLKVLSGRDISGFDMETATAEQRAQLMTTDVFARVAPDTKLNLVSLFQKGGHVVAMTGDGVNDAPALKKADIGIAMGKRGTQVAREASDIVLKDDDFATIIAAMRQGRIIFENIRKFVVYLMSCNVSEVLIVGIAVGVGLPVPLLPLQILFLNLVTDVFPAFALGFGKGDDGVMQRPPRDPREPIVDRSRWILIGYVGCLITISTLSAFAVALFLLGLETDRAITVAFLTLALSQLWNVFNMRVAAGSVWKSDVLRNGYVWGAIALCLGLIALAMLNRDLAALLALPWPGRLGLTLAVVTSFVPLVFGQVWIWLMSRNCGSR